LFYTKINKNKNKSKKKELAVYSKLVQSLFVYYSNIDGSNGNEKCLVKLVLDMKLILKKTAYVNEKYLEILLKFSQSIIEAISRKKFNCKLRIKYRKIPLLCKSKNYIF
jgi:hypothetical protein